MERVDKQELVFRYPDGKPPFVGILFEHLTRAESVNQGWVNSYRTYYYQLTFEITAEFVLVIVSLNTFGWKHTYKCIKQPRAEHDIRAFMKKVEKLPYFKFGHVTMELGTMCPARTSVNRAIWVLRINRVEFLRES